MPHHPGRVRGRLGPLTFIRVRVVPSLDHRDILLRELVKLKMKVCIARNALRSSRRPNWGIDIERDASDPQLLANLRELGQVKVDHRMETERTVREHYYYCWSAHILARRPLPYPPYCLVVDPY